MYSSVIKNIRVTLENLENREKNTEIIYNQSTSKITIIKMLVDFHLFFYLVYSQFLFFFFYYSVITNVYFFL